MSTLRPILTIDDCVVSTPAAVVFVIVDWCTFSLPSTLPSLELDDSVILLLRSINSCSSTKILADLLDISLLISVKPILFFIV